MAILQSRSASDFLDHAVIAVVGSAIVLAACGSSSVDALRSAGGPGRWVALVALAGLASCRIGVAVRQGSGRLSPLPDVRPYVVAALLLAVMAVSATWSVAGTLTVKRTVSFALVLAAAGALGVLAALQPSFLARLLVAVPAAAVGVVVAGLVYLAVDPAGAIQPTSPASVGRFRGIGENPNTVPILCTVAIPIALSLCASGSWRRRGVAALGAIMLFGQIVFSGSRGAFLGGLCGLLVAIAVWPAPLRRRVLVAAMVVVVYVGAFAVVYKAAGGLRKNSGAAVPALPQQAAPRAVRHLQARQAGPVRSEPAFPLVPSYTGEIEEELGVGGPSGRRLFGSSGRSGAWRGTIRQAGQRPILGFGFGTEEQVFFDRYFNFQGGHAESSFIGIYLQLGLVGLALLLALLAAFAASTVRATRRRESAGHRPLAAAASGAVAAGLVQALFQSFVYSAGNVGTLALWTCAFALAAAAGPPLARAVRERSFVGAAL